MILHGAASSLTRKGALQENRPEQPGTYSSGVPLADIRSVGKGRIMYLGITTEYLFGPFAQSTLEGIVLDQGLKGTPSDGYTLLVNSLRWLAQPSQNRFGSARNDEALLRNPQKVRFSEPYAWPERITLAQPEPALAGVVGLRTRYSGGKASTVEWVEKAKAAGLAWIVFLEDFPNLSKDGFEKLKIDCARLSSAQFNRNSRG